MNDSSQQQYVESEVFVDDSGGPPPAPQWVNENSVTWTDENSVPWTES